MYFKEAADEINKILNGEGINFSYSFKRHLFIILSEMCNYSEEDHRIRPQIILGVNLQTYFETITPKNYLVMYEDELSGENLPRFFKSLALFCDNGWYIVVNVNRDKLEYGIFRRYINIDGERFEDFFKNSFDKGTDGHMIILKAVNNSDIAVIRCNEPDFLISQRFIETNEAKQGYEENYLNLAADVVEKCNLKDKDYIKRCFLKMIRNFPLKIHGTIMLVVDDSFELPDAESTEISEHFPLSGIHISPSIDFSDLFLQYKNVGRYSEAENVYSLTGVLYEMLNTDGITIISNKARVLYYNVFYEGEVPKNIKGGARKRTATGILKNQELSGIIGVYFQSQDGDIFYERRVNS